MTKRDLLACLAIILAAVCTGAMLAGACGIVPPGVK